MPRNGATARGRATPTDFAAVLDRFRLPELCQEIGASYDTVFSWKRRNSIPQEHWRDIAAAAKTLGARGVSLVVLRRIGEATVTSRAERRRRRKRLAKVPAPETETPSWGHYSESI